MGRAGDLEGDPSLGLILKGLNGHLVRCLAFEGMSFAGLNGGKPGGATATHVGSPELVLLKVVAFQENSIAVWMKLAEVTSHVVEGEAIAFVLVIEKGVKGGELGRAEFAAEEMFRGNGVDGKEMGLEKGRW